MILLSIFDVSIDSQCPFVRKPIDCIEASEKFVNICFFTPGVFLCGGVFSLAFLCAGVREVLGGTVASLGAVLVEGEVMVPGLDLVFSCVFLERLKFE